MLFLGIVTCDLMFHMVFFQAVLLYSPSLLPSKCANSYTTSLANQVSVFLLLPFYQMRIIVADKLSSWGVGIP